MRDGAARQQRGPSPSKDPSPAAAMPRRPLQAPPGGTPPADSKCQIALSPLSSVHAIVSGAGSPCGWRGSRQPFLLCLRNQRPLNTEEACPWCGRNSETCLLAPGIQTASILCPLDQLLRRPHARRGVPAPWPPRMSGQVSPAAPTSSCCSFLGRSRSLCLGRQQVTRTSDSGQVMSGAPCSALYRPASLPLAGPFCPLGACQVPACDLWHS